jgi:hypothetical protein
VLGLRFSSTSPFGVLRDRPERIGLEDWVNLEFSGARSVEQLGQVVRLPFVNPALIGEFNMTLRKIPRD